MSGLRITDGTTEIVVQVLGSDGEMHDTKALYWPYALVLSPEEQQILFDYLFGENPSD